MRHLWAACALESGQVCLRQEPAPRDYSFVAILLLVYLRGLVLWLGVAAMAFALGAAVVQRDTK